MEDVAGVDGFDECPLLGFFFFGSIFGVHGERLTKYSGAFQELLGLLDQRFDFLQAGIPSLRTFISNGVFAVA